jgi:hypothetical protein
MEEAESRSGNGSLLMAVVISPEGPGAPEKPGVPERPGAEDFSGVRYYAGTPDLDGGLVEFAGFYRENSAEGGAYALGIFPDGRGVYGRGEEARARTAAFALPPLPEGFVYTRICLLGNVIAAAWEEQDGWNIGAAGFLVINIPAIKD